MTSVILARAHTRRHATGGGYPRWMRQSLPCRRNARLTIPPSHAPCRDPVSFVVALWHGSRESSRPDPCGSRGFTLQPLPCPSPGWRQGRGFALRDIGARAGLEQRLPRNGPRARRRRPRGRCEAQGSRNRRGRARWVVGARATGPCGAVRGGSQVARSAPVRCLRAVRAQCRWIEVTGAPRDTWGRPWSSMLMRLCRPAAAKAASVRTTMSGRESGSGHPLPWREPGEGQGRG